MSKKKKKKQSVVIALKLQRKLALQQGFYDGRFKEKVIGNKKKDSEKKLSRRKVDLKKEE